MWTDTMLPKLTPIANHLGRDVADKVPPVSEVKGAEGLRPQDDAIWELALPFLGVRDNDGHTIYAYGLARALLDLHPQADPDVVLPAILLHDTGWSQVPVEDILAAIAPGASRPELVVLHEKEGARIAADVLARLGHDVARTAEVVQIIDGHDSRLEALSLNDSLVKDADKLWRLTPHGLDTVMEWFGLDRAGAHRLVASRVHDHLFTDVGRTMGRALGAVAAIDTCTRRVSLG